MDASSRENSHLQLTSDFRSTRSRSSEIDNVSMVRQENVILETKKDDKIHKNHKKDTWSNQLEYFLTILGYGVGLGNLWRFPYLCYQHGGFTFLIPYIFFLILCGLPLCILESCLGQFSGLNIISVWAISPLFKGVGFTSLILIGICCLYYNVIIAYGIYYLVESCKAVIFGTVLPYSEESDYCQTVLVQNTSLTKNNMSCAEYYYSNEILMDDQSYTSLGTNSINKNLIFYLGMAWLLLLFSQIKSTSSTGKISYVTGILPYILITALLITVLCLEGSVSVGIKQYVTVDWSALKNGRIWTDAAIQVFYSQGAGTGCLLALASHNKFKTNVFKYSIMLSIANALTSIYSGFMVFGTLGFLALQQNNGNIQLAMENFSHVVKSSHKLAFVVYPVALSKMGKTSGKIFAVLFFLMLVILGLGSMVGFVVTIIDSLMGDKGHGTIQRFISITFLFSFMFLLSYPFVTFSGIQWIGVFDQSLCLFSFFVIAFMECGAICWHYGVDRVIGNFRDMLSPTSTSSQKFQFPGKTFFRLCWKYIIPVTTLIFFQLTLIGVVNNGFKIGNSEWPLLAEIVGWLIQIVQILPIGYYLIKYHEKNGSNEVDEATFFRNRDRFYAEKLINMDARYEGPQQE